MKPDRVVLDANVFIALILGKKLDELVRWYKDESIEIVICEELINELKDVLNRDRINKRLSNPVTNYLSFIESVSKKITIDKRFDRAPDIKDNYLFDLAYTAKSHYLVTADRPLLNLKQVNKIRVISATAFRKLVRADK